MTWSDKWYPETIASLKQLVGDGANGYDGQPMPNLSALDTVAILGIVTKATISCIDKYNQSNNRVSTELAAVRSDGVDSAGNIAGVEMVSTTPYIDAKTYIGYQPDVSEIGLTSAAPWKRFPPSPPYDGGAVEAIQSYEVYWSSYNSVYSNAAELDFVRQLISDYQRMVDSSVAAIQSNPSNTTAPADVDALGRFLSSLRGLCADLDVLNDVPPALASMTSALKFALAQTAEFVGKASAEIANEVGKEAGIIGQNLTEGFLQNAGILSFVVLAIVIHLFI